MRLPNALAVVSDPFDASADPTAYLGVIDGLLTDIGAKVREAGWDPDHTMVSLVQTSEGQAETKRVYRVEAHVDRYCASCRAPTSYAIVLRGLVTPACLRHVNVWESPPSKPRPLKPSEVPPMSLTEVIAGGA